MTNLFREFPNAKKAGIILLFLTSFLFSGSAAQIFAHGGEDHGGQKPKATTNDKGTVTRTMRLGEYELTLKHPFLKPDTATAARLFITRFETNEASDKTIPAIEIESANGLTEKAAIEKTEIAGSYNVKIPALPQGVYTFITKLTYDGETDTATFSGVEVATAPIVEGEISWARTALIAFVFALILALFGGLIYIVRHYAEGEPLKEETVSA